MKSKFLFILAIAASSLTVSAQNLVPNGSFEEVILCPEFSSNLDNECPLWYTSLVSDIGDVSTPEWFHTCSDVDIMAPPDIAFGNQSPYDGNGFAGLVAFVSSTSEGRELIAVELVEPLEIGQSYLVEFVVSNMYFPDFAIASSKLGFNFSTHQYYHKEAFPINSSQYYFTEIIPISSGWISVNEVFEADSAYTYFHIGNFFDDENTETIADTPFANTTYYAIDAVSVTPLLSSKKFD